jgi:hypothetical protein
VGRRVQLPDGCQHVLLAPQPLAVPQTRFAFAGNMLYRPPHTRWAAPVKHKQSTFTDTCAVSGTSGSPPIHKHNTQLCTLITLLH